jgi:hypothetical protein
MAITRPLSGRLAATMAYKLSAGHLPAHPCFRRPPMTERHGWKPVSRADDEDDDDDEEGDDENEDDDE